MTASPWVQRWSGLIPAAGRVLDLACGGGRHACYLASLGYRVDAVDIDLRASEPVRATAGVTWLERDLENDAVEIEAQAYQGVVVTNYLHRPLLPKLLAALAPDGGVLIYETFAHGQQRFGRPRNPAHLLLPGELLEVVRGELRVTAYEDIVLDRPAKARVQRICAIKP
jgi:SAM-dependent methyltransferase